MNAEIYADHRESIQQDFRDTSYKIVAELGEVMQKVKPAPAPGTLTILNAVGKYIINAYIISKLILGYIYFSFQGLGVEDAALSDVIYHIYKSRMD